MFDRKAIMQAAWNHYQHQLEIYAPWQIERGIVDVSLAASLREAWHHARARAARQKREAAIERALKGPNARFVRVILRNLETLDCRPWRVNIETIHADYTARLNSYIEA